MHSATTYPLVGTHLGSDPKGGPVEITGTLQAGIECLRHFSKHLTDGEWAATGSLAFLSYPGSNPGLSNRRLQDLDLLVKGPSSLSSTVTERFLVSHFHLPWKDGSSLFFQFADPVTGFRVDLFADPGSEIDRARFVASPGLTYPVVTESDLLEHKLEMLREARVERPVDPKHHADAIALVKMVGGDESEIPNRHLVPNTYQRDLNRRCVKCERSQIASFPLASKDRILELWGHV